MSIYNILVTLLPLEIVIKIYAYEPTYRIFKNINFNIKLKNYKIIKKL